jgi:hypothetical protein
VKRIVVVGAGFFGRLVARRLADLGLAPLVATRRGADLTLDVEDERSLRALLRSGDVVVDTAGPFSARTTRAAIAALEIGCDYVDIAESLPWSEAMLALSERAAAGMSRLYPACSAVAAVAGACVRASGMTAPTSADLFIAPASAETASPATVRGLTATIGRPLRTLRGGRLAVGRG